MPSLPSLFVSHGPPSLILDDVPARGALMRVGGDLPRPEAVLCISAHWSAPVATASLADRPATIHDFFGFPRALYEIAYPAPGAPAVSSRALHLLETAGFACARDETRGLDHGAWEPLMLMYPNADVPVATLSLIDGGDAAAHLALGRALAPLREEGVLILASGTATHNLAAWRADQDETPSWAVAFEAWLIAAVEAGDETAIAEYRTRAPHAELAHPSEEHYLPVAIAMGAAGRAGMPGRVLHRGFSYGSLSMAAFAFG